ncbi:MAG: acetyl-CoA decarbonylase/synthase complex subunit gamma [Oligoflexia bacterium]|nr:acetyl-CoA decarbonylase/synthase complex subunit gamma [Oligoflexia bacterium]
MAALTGLQIQKLLPKTNCKECGSNTCLAFAMKLASKKIELSKCPYASEEAKKILGAASEPPVKSVEIGGGASDKDNYTYRIGEETEIYRHEKTFVNRTLFAININSDDEVENIDKVINFVKNYRLDRAGETLFIEMISLTHKATTTATTNTFIELAKKIHKETNRPLILRSDDLSALTSAAIAIKGSKSILATIATPNTTTDNNTELIKIAQENEHALVISGKDLDSIVNTTEKIRANDLNFNNLILELPTLSYSESFQINSITRRAAIKDQFKPLGYPTIKFISSTENIFESAESAVCAINEITKYGGICVFPSSDADPALLAPLMTLRMNIYTDPQKPIQVDPKVYQIGEPNKSAPIFVTTNFSLTYFMVSGEIENSGISAYLLVPQCEGMSVLTAWAAGKFSGASIAKFIKEISLEQQLESRTLIIPGYVAQISGELEENLPGWKVMVGPQEAADIESFVKARLM